MRHSSLQIIHGLALEKDSQFRKAEAELLDVLQQIDAQKVLLGLDIHTPSSSILVLDQLLAVQSIGRTPEACAGNFITVARKAIEVPELKEEIKRGELSVSKARKITPVLHKENQQEWIQKAKTLPQRNSNEPKTSSAIRNKSLRLWKKLSKNCLLFFLKKKDPVEKARRAEEKIPDSKGLEFFSSAVDSVEKRRSIAAQKNLLRSSKVSKDFLGSANRMSEKNKSHDLLHR